MGLMQERVVVVTGASRGAGKGIALALGATGDTVYVEYHMEQQGDGIRVTKIRAEQGSEARSTRQDRGVCSIDAD